MQTINIRKATQADCTSILALVKELALFEKAPEEVTISLSELEQTGFGNSPIWWAFVAEKGNQIIGMALFYIRFSTWKGRCLYLEDLYVKESERENGVGQQLLDAIIQEAQEKKYHRVNWQVLEWNEPAIAFYQKNKARLDPEWINCSLPLD